MRFAERHGHVSPREVFQIDSLDVKTRNQLMNAFIQRYLPNIGDILTYEGQAAFELLITDYFKRPLSFATNRYSSAVKSLEKWAQECEWYHLLDFLEFVKEIEPTQNFKYFKHNCNYIFTNEKVGFKFIRDTITPITSKEETQAIEEALSAPGRFIHAREHIQRSLELYSDRKSSDYRNSIKEAVSAVESVCREISGEKSATLSDALKLLDKKNKVHPAFKEALLKLYGYTSDKSGIRHSFSDASKVDEPEAKFMLVSCSAFCNYLIANGG